MRLRAITPNDAEQFLRLCRRLDEETQFMMLEPGERVTTIEEQRNHIETVLSKENQIIIVVEHDGQLVES